MAEQVKLKRNFDLQILGLDGKPVRAGVSPDSMLDALAEFLPTLEAKDREAFDRIMEAKKMEPLTLRKVCCDSLLAPYEDEKNLDGAKAIERMELARLIYKGGIQEITPTQRDLVKPLFRKRYGGVLVPVVASELLEKDAPVGVT